ncbi:hypothetical protein FIBSPDRAFT_951400 [Athelia psychrophila]|uniref:Uncharacterized protein n=1 Tax=Athelia psychrophila TaxID=1759441 RepID=A0A166MKG9_9AGAM|nr:hypothetical protein FIBSPDRAFT_951400 [Fibularhizoctonia sp. CBS 109695]
MQLKCITPLKAAWLPKASSARQLCTRRRFGNDHSGDFGRQPTRLTSTSSFARYSDAGHDPRYRPADPRGHPGHQHPHAERHRYHQNLTPGSINNVNLSPRPIVAEAHQNITSPVVPLAFNLNPMVIIELKLDTAAANVVDLGPLVALFNVALSEPNFVTSITSYVDAGPAVGNQFDVYSAILAALKGLKVNLAIESSLKLDEYPTNLSFNQTGLHPLYRTVGGADLVFTGANITNLTDTGFSLALAGSLTNIGPLDAKITFSEPVIVNWEGTDIANIALPPVCAAANTGVPTYNPDGQLTILDLDAFTTFTSYLLHAESFTWTIHTDKLTVEALGTVFNNVNLSKNVTLLAFNELPGVTISNFMLPSNDPTGGIHIDNNPSIPSPSFSLQNLGIDLGIATFLAYYGGVEVGPLRGRIIPQNGTNADTIGQLFTQYLQADAIILEVQGQSVTPEGASAPITWLSNAFQTLNISVILQDHSFQIIESIAINNFQVEIETAAEAFAPLLMLPSAPSVGGVSTGNVADLPLTFSNVTFQALNDGAMQVLFQAITDTPGGDLTLAGTANVTVKTTSGDIPIGDIAFNVPSSLAGINGFGGTAGLSGLSVSGSGGTGGDQFVIAPLTTTLQNPSNVSLTTNDIALPVIYQGVQLGRAAISPFYLIHYPCSRWPI